MRYKFKYSEKQSLYLTAQEKQKREDFEKNNKKNPRVIDEICKYCGHDRLFIGRAGIQSHYISKCCKCGKYQE